MRGLALALVLGCLGAASGCTSESTNTSAGGNGGSAGSSGGSGGSSTGGNAGSSGGSGSGGVAGSAGVGGGAAGSGGVATGGAAGSGGVAASSGTGGVAGSGGACVGDPVVSEQCTSTTGSGKKYTCCQTGSATSFVSWDAARSSCQAKCLDLVKVGDDATNDALKNLNGNANKWIGLKRTGTNPFQWVDKTPLLGSDYQSWGANEPSAPPGQGCVLINSTLAKNWSDTVCTGDSLIAGTVRGWCCE
ncbi:MAG: C-type lectin domain-containing protein [Myxococcales bacterium]|nr:C-type lectin domain-containing protein [Myxococcales bacterium]